MLKTLHFGNQKCTTITTVANYYCGIVKIVLTSIFQNIICGIITKTTTVANYYYSIVKSVLTRTVHSIVYSIVCGIGYSIVTITTRTAD